MKVLVKKMSKIAVLKFQMIVGAIVMLVAAVALPISIVTVDPELILNPFILGTVIVTLLIFVLCAYFLFMRPLFLYRKLPEALVETDGKNLYIHGKKQATIPLSAFADAVVTYHLPFIYSKEFIAVVITYFFSEQYGDLYLDVPEYGCYKMQFVANVQEVSNELLQFLGQAINNAEEAIVK